MKIIIVPYKGSNRDAYVVDNVKDDKDLDDDEKDEIEEHEELRIMELELEHGFRIPLFGWTKRLSCGIPLIPTSFMERYLKGQRMEYGELRRGNRKWKVKIINGRVMEEEGWSKFWEENEVEVGDFLVFRHEGDLVFEVLLFDPSALLKPILFPPPHVKQEIILDDHQSPLLAKCVKQHKFHGSNKIPKWKQRACTKFGYEDKATSSRNTHSDGHPYFTSTLTPYNIKSALNIPMKFARPNGLAGRDCEMIMKDERGRSWPLRLKHDGSHVYISRGFRQFNVANGLKAGDSFIIQLLHNGYKPLMNFIRLNKIPKMKPARKLVFEEKASCSRNSNDGGEHGHPSFSSTLTASNININVMYIPMEFARTNGLTNRKCEMIMKDEKGRSWPMRLRHNGSHVSVSKGFHQFHTANGLKEGDSFIIQLLQNGNKPLMNFLGQDFWRPDLSTSQLTRKCIKKAGTRNK
ncbi:hypothetical protein LguiB_026687 [Lonicera macranthoides]